MVAGFSSANSKPRSRVTETEAKNKRVILGTSEQSWKLNWLVLHRKMLSKSVPKRWQEIRIISGKSISTLHKPCISPLKMQKVEDPVIAVHPRLNRSTACDLSRSRRDYLDDSLTAVESGFPNREIGANAV